jgi:acetyl esterase/lipase
LAKLQDNGAEMTPTRICLIVPAMLLACANAATSQERPARPQPKLPPGVTALRDLEYIEDGHPRNRLDLYLPEKAEGRLPLIVWIHGGGWMAGGKEACPAVPLVKKGYAVASVNYRLSQHAVFPAQIEDCKAAIRWLRARAAKYHIDPDHVGVWGSSAGGHLVALLGTTGNVKELEGQGGNLEQSSRVQCVVDWFGPSDLATMGGGHDNPGSPEARLIGGPVQENKEKARKASPLTYAGKDSAPFLIMHGDQDNTVPLSQSQVLAEALKKAGVEARLVVVKGSGHGGPGFNSPENRKLIEDFLDKHLHGGHAGGAKLQSPEKPRVLITISKETTYITAPLRKDGYVNYVAALNERNAAGVTPENNAAVPFLKAMGPGEIDAKYRDEYFKRLKIAPLPEQGDYYVTLDSYVKSKNAGRPAAKENIEEIYSEQQTKARKRAWSNEEFPVLAGWLAANEKPLELLVAASKRPRRFDPLVPESGAVLDSRLPAIAQYRETARALIARAMLRLGEGKSDEAWEDLLACHRLARLAGQGPTLVEALVAIAVDGLACAGDQGLLQHARLTPAQIAMMRDDLDKLAPLPGMTDKINLGERFLFLDAVGMVAREGFDSLTILSDSRKPKGMIESLMDSAARHSVDWDLILHMVNSWYDRDLDAYHKSTRAERQAALFKIEGDVRKLTEKTKDWKSLGLAMSIDRRQAVSERIGWTFVVLLLPAISAASNAEDRGNMQFDVTRLGFALAAYHADRGTYPARLADLAPKYVAKVPQDIFSASELHYRREGNGYLLYSVGANGKDDGGKGYDDRKAGEDWDDLSVRVPAASEQKP